MSSFDRKMRRKIAIEEIRSKSALAGRAPPKTIAIQDLMQAGCKLFNLGMSREDALLIINHVWNAGEEEKRENPKGALFMDVEMIPPGLNE